MNKRVMAFSAPGGANYYGFIICAAMFICGCAAGVAAAAYINSAGLSGYMADYLGGGQAVRPDFWSCLLSACKYHLLAVFFGFSLLGAVCVPALSAVRGFFLCFSVSATVRLYGGDGAALALAMFGVGAVMTVPCFFVLAVQSFSSSLSIFRMVISRGARSGTAAYGDGFFRRCCICATVLICSAAVDMLLTPRLVAYAAARII